MLTYKKDDFDENLDDIMNSINEILNKKKITCDNKENEDNNDKTVNKD